MIYDKIANAGLYRFDHPGLMGAIRDMLCNLHGEFAEGAGFRKNTIVFTTVPKEEKRYEAHKRFIDIHVVLEGKEYVEIAPVDCLSNSTAYDTEADIYFGEVTATCKFSGYLEKGHFLLCFPEDAHLVGAHESDKEASGQPVSKIVYKIAV
ncbi:MULTISPECIES: YhcH/YjgK/YiaL family protein [Paenibacillus]|uniref:YhcH/YjgK/YiaL family protein n=1 Tax=Paenibacillus residui TaxID=629724 RepID=A0ABW3D4Y6_9BACL|nr:YhcH/YjgK/YiaL family protein [Paenibacillus sp. 32O-W]